MGKPATKLRFAAKPRHTLFNPLLPIRSAKPNDHEKIATLMHEAYNVWFGSVLPSKPTLEEAKGFVKDFFASSAYPEATLVSGPPGKIVSALLVSRPTADGLPTIADVFTHPLYRARGLATSLITECLNILFRNGQPGLEIVVDSMNEPMIRILRKLDFEESELT